MIVELTERIPTFFEMSPSAEGRLFTVVSPIDYVAVYGVMKVGSVHERLDGHQRVWAARRSWPEALKREVVAASFEPGASVLLVARRYDVNTNQLFIWRRRYRDGMREVSCTAGPELLPVKITEERVAEPTAPPPVSGDKVEIELPNGYRVRIDPGIDVKALRRMVDVLERR